MAFSGPFNIIRLCSVGIVLLLMLLSSAWLFAALYFQQPLSFGTQHSAIFTYMLQILWLLMALLCGVALFWRAAQYRRLAILIYATGFALALTWYFNIPAQANRDWNPEVARVLWFSKQGNMVTLHNVRNFDWQQNGRYQQRWETRRYDLNHLQGVNIITSYWMGPQIAHTLVSFNFAKQHPLVFSIEIRKERGEDFSAIGGFFRKFELSLIAADEYDIVYNRSNIRHEQVYFFPIQISQSQQKALFLQYLKTAEVLRKSPHWYNTLSSNCTTLVFDMAKKISPTPLPLDYRLLASGYLPNYLYDLDVLDTRWSLHTWYARAHVNPRTAYFNQFKHRNSHNYSALLRLGLDVSASTTP